MIPHSSTKILFFTNRFRRTAPKPPLISSSPLSSLRQAINHRLESLVVKKLSKLVITTNNPIYSLTLTLHDHVLTLQVDNGSILRPPSLIPKSESRRSTNPLDLFNDDGLYDVFLNIREPNLMAMKNTRRNYIAFKR